MAGIVKEYEVETQLDPVYGYLLGCYVRFPLTLSTAEMNSFIGHLFVFCQQLPFMVHLFKFRPQSILKFKLKKSQMWEKISYVTFFLHTGCLKEKVPILINPSNF